METQIATGSVAAPFEAVVAPHYDGLVRRLAFIVGDPEDAKDLAQAAYLKALEAWPRFDGSDPRGWLYTIGINLAISELRRRRRWRRRAPVTEPTWALCVDPDLLQAIGELDASQRAALLLNVLDGYTEAEAVSLPALSKPTYQGRLRDLGVPKGVEIVTVGGDKDGNLMDVVYIDKQGKYHCIPGAGHCWVSVTEPNGKVHDFAVAPKATPAPRP